MASNRVHTKWNGQPFLVDFQKATARGIQRAAAFYWNQCRLAVSVTNVGVRKKRKRATKAGPKGSQYTIYPHPSKPGQPPRLRTSMGRSSIAWVYNNNPKDPRARVGVRTNAKYMIFLELGTRRIRPRPWLLSTLRKYKKQIAAIATEKIP